MGNNPVKYVDPDGRDIEEIELCSNSAAAVGALRLSAGIAFDSNGNVAAYLKAEIGIGAGTNTGFEKLFTNVPKIIKILGLIEDGLSSSKIGTQLGKEILIRPEDTGEGNFDDFLNIVSENFRDWDTLPSEGAFFIGAEGDKNGQTSLSLGVKVIAATYLSSTTFYLKLPNLSAPQKTYGFKKFIEKKACELRDYIIMRTFLHYFLRG